MSVSLSNHMPSPSEKVEHWIEAAQQGSTDALGQVLAYCRPYLLAVANEQIEPNLQAKVGASDVVQETFLEAQRDLAQFRGRSEGDMLAWLRQILLHNVANLSRQYRETDKRRIQREIPLGADRGGGLFHALLDKGSSPSAQAQRRERDQALEQALAQLPADYRHVIQWRSYQRCSFEEIGNRLQRSAGAARKLWTRAIENLQRILGSADESR